MPRPRNLRNPTTFPIHDAKIRRSVMRLGLSCGTMGRGFARQPQQGEDGGMGSVVLIVDDHPVVPLALRSLIEGRFDGVRALQASSLRQAKVLYRDEPGDIG
jgi:hypothetical protein